jgi:hypothetical protein
LPVFFIGIVIGIIVIVAASSVVGGNVEMSATEAPMPMPALLPLWQ